VAKRRRKRRRDMSLAVTTRKIMRRKTRRCRHY
jgi:hypothetical protein